MCDSVYLVRDIPVFVMYCVYGASYSSLLIEFTDSMIVRGSKEECLTGALFATFSLHHSLFSLDRTFDVCRTRSQHVLHLYVFVQR